MWKLVPATSPRCCWYKFICPATICKYPFVIHGSGHTVHPCYNSHKREATYWLYYYTCANFKCVFLENFSYVCFAMIANHCKPFMSRFFWWRVEKWQTLWPFFLGIIYFLLSTKKVFLKINNLIFPPKYTKYGKNVGKQNCLFQRYIQLWCWLFFS